MTTQTVAITGNILADLDLHLAANPHRCTEELVQFFVDRLPSVHPRDYLGLVRALRARGREFDSAFLSALHRFEGRT